MDMDMMEEGYDEYDDIGELYDPPGMYDPPPAEEVGAWGWTVPGRPRTIGE
jgi:hypothetical protein